jgi:hypothetical protein
VPLQCPSHCRLLLLLLVVVVVLLLPAVACGRL